MKPPKQGKNTQVEISKLNYFHLCLGTRFGNTTPRQETARAEDTDGSDHTDIKHIRTRNESKAGASGPTRYMMNAWGCCWGAASTYLEQ